MSSPEGDVVGILPPLGPLPVMKFMIFQQVSSPDTTACPYRNDRMRRVVSLSGDPDLLYS